MPTIKKLHPTLKKCACGWVGSKRDLYIHFAELRRSHLFYYEHGEVPLNEDFQQQTNITYDNTNKSNVS